MQKLTKVPSTAVISSKNVRSFYLTIRGLGLGFGVVVALFFIPLPAFAQVTNKTSDLALSNKKPIQIESEKLEIDDKGSRAIFTGNVEVLQGELTLRAGKMIVYYLKKKGSVSDGNGEIDRIEVSQKVYLNSKNQTATADQGVFHMRSQQFKLTGKQVILTEGENIFIGCKLIVKMKSGDAKLEACGKRIKIQLDPSASRKK